MRPRRKGKVADPLPVHNLEEALFKTALGDVIRLLPKGQLFRRVYDERWNEQQGYYEYAHWKPLEAIGDTDATDR